MCLLPAILVFRVILSKSSTFTLPTLSRNTCCKVHQLIRNHRWFSVRVYKPARPHNHACTYISTYVLYEPAKYMTHRLISDRSLIRTLAKGVRIHPASTLLPTSANQTLPCTVKICQEPELQVPVSCSNTDPLSNLSFQNICKGDFSLPPLVPACHFTLTSSQLCFFCVFLPTHTHPPNYPTPLLATPPGPVLRNRVRRFPWLRKHKNWGKFPGY